MSPSLRFPEFTGEWEKCKIEDITDAVSSGKSKNHFSNGEYNLYGSTGIIGRTDKALYDGKLVLVARVGANAGFLQIINEPCGITDNTLILKPKGIDAFYLYYFLQHFNLNRLIFGSGQPLITGGMLKKVKVSLGTISEQSKIVKFLSLLDERTAVQSRLIEDLKKLRCAIVEKMFKQSKANGRLGDFIEQVSVRNKNGLYSNVLSVSNKQGFVKQSEQFEDRAVASEDTSNYKIVKRNNFAYNPARINVGSIARLTKFDVGIVSPMYVCFRTKASIIPEYMEAFFTSQQFFYEMMKRLEGSVRLCLSYEGLCNIPVYIPDMNKQIAMGQNISLILSKIGLEIEYLGRLHQQKQYLLRKMFI